MAAVDFLCQPFYFDLEDGPSLLELEPLPFDGDDTGLELSLSNIVLDGTLGETTTLLPTTTTTTTTTKRKKRPRVSFQEGGPTCISVPSLACLAEDQRRGLWYRPVEIDQFRSSARDACRILREDPFAFPEDITRGLELRTSLDRQWRKHLARNCILKAQVRFPQIDSEHLATIAERCTALPREEAVTQATRDYCAVYHPDQKYNNTSFLSSSSHCVVNNNAIPLQCLALHQPLLVQNNSHNNEKPTTQFAQQKKRPSLDLDKDEDDSSSSEEGGEEDSELHIHDRIAKRYRIMNESEECLFADLDFEI